MTLQSNVIILLISPYLRPKPNRIFIFMCTSFFLFYKKKLYYFPFFATICLISLIFTDFRFILTAQRCKFKIYKTCRSISRAIITQCTNFHIFKSAANSTRMRCSVVNPCIKKKVFRFKIFASKVTNQSLNNNIVK